MRRSGTLISKNKHSVLISDFKFLGSILVAMRALDSGSFAALPAPGGAIMFDQSARFRTLMYDHYHHFALRISLSMSKVHTSATPCPSVSYDTIT